MPATMYYDQDADLGLLKGKTIAVIGYGSQGHAQAQNLRDSGCNVVVGQRPGSANYDQAVKDGFKPVSAAEAAEAGDLVNILLHDEVQADVYARDITRPAVVTVGKDLVDDVKKSVFDLRRKDVFDFRAFNAKRIEITRGAIQSIHFGQTEAGKAIGLAFWPRMIHIVFPQALRRFPQRARQVELGRMLHVVGIADDRRHRLDLVLDAIEA